LTERKDNRNTKRIGARKGLAGEQMGAFIELQMKAIRQVVLDLDVAGRSEGGRHKE
jgi:hypothetical protein